MNDKLQSRDDSALLALWVNEQRHDAFADLVGAYQRMVVAAAIRRTGDSDAARDVAQQVFATLATKARWLLGRQSVAGWLYNAASFFASRLARAEARRHAAISRFAEEATSARNDTTGHLDEALAALPEAEREAIVLHFFQDTGYPEMAALLGISEPAARKRVSRALAGLERQLARVGIRGGAVALITGAVAQQGMAVAPVGLAAAASGGSMAVPWALSLSIMAKHTFVKITACAAVLLAVPLALQWNATANARTLSTAPSGLQPSTAMPQTVPAELAALRSDLAAKRDAADAAERRSRDLAEVKHRVDNEVVYSLGTLERMAKELTEVVRIFESLERKVDITTEEGKRVAEEKKKDGARLAALMPKVYATLREIPKIERSPAKAARFYSTLYSEITGMDESLLPALEGRVSEWFGKLRADSLTFAQRPGGEARKDWDVRRQKETVKFIQETEREFPSQHSLLDTEVFSDDREPEALTESNDMLFGNGGGK